MLTDDSTPDRRGAHSPSHATDDSLVQSFFDAIRDGDVNAVKAALKTGASPDAADADSTALCHAVFDGTAPIVRALLKAGADPNLADVRGFLPLAVAASKDHAALIKLIVDAGADVEGAGAQGGTALHTAAASGATRALKKLLAAGASVEAIDAYGAPPLHYAAMHGHDACLKGLLAAGAAVDVTDAAGRTALLHAMDGMHRHRVKDWTGLGLFGANPVTFRIRDGEFLCEDAAGYVHRPPVAAERKLAAMNPAHTTYVGCRDCATRLIKAEANITVPGPNGRTAVHELAALGEGDLLNKLLKSGADPHATDTSGRTIAHHLATCRRTSAIEQKWVKAHVDFTRDDADGNHALHIAAATGPFELVKRLYYDHFYGDGEPARLLDTNQAGLTASQCVTNDAQIRELLDRESDRVAKALRRVRGWPIDLVTERLESGTHVFTVFEGFPSYRTDHQFVRVMSADHLVDAFVHTSTGDISDVKVQPRSAWDVEAKAYITDGSIQIQLLPIGDLPDGTRDKMLSCASGANDRLAQLRAGTHACMTDSGWGILHDSAEGWLSIIITNGVLTDITPMAEERVLSDVNAPGSRMVSVGPDLRSEVTARIEKARVVGARYEAGLERLVTRAWTDEVDGYVLIGGDHALVRSKAGRVRDARLVGIAHRVPASIWGGTPTWDAVDLDGPLGLVAALRAGELAAVHAAAADGRIELVVNGPDGTVRIKQDAPMTADWLATQLADGLASLMVFNDTTEAPAGDTALIEAMRAASPAAIASAVGRSGTKRMWRMPGLEVSLYGYSIIWYDGSDNVQPMIDYLDNGPPREVAEEIAAEIRAALLLVAKSL